MTYTTSGRFNQMSTGSRNNTWGIGLNDEVIGLIDTMIAGVTTLTVTGDHTLSSLNGQADEARAAQLALIGSPAANFTLTCPNVPKLYRVFNATGKVATFTCGGDTVSVDSGDIIDISTDGVDFTTPGVGGVGWKDYIASVVAGGPYGNVPSVIGQTGKFLTNNGTLPLWAVINSTDLGDYSTNILGKGIAFAVSL